jgi:hypothetical protein
MAVGGRRLGEGVGSIEVMRGSMEVGEGRGWGQWRWRIKGGQGGVCCVCVCVWGGGELWVYGAGVDPLVQAAELNAQAAWLCQVRE